MHLHVTLDDSGDSDRHVAGCCRVPAACHPAGVCDYWLGSTNTLLTLLGLIQPCMAAMMSWHRHVPHTHCNAPSGHACSSMLNACYSILNVARPSAGAAQGGHSHCGGARRHRARCAASACQLLGRCSVAAMYCACMGDRIPACELQHVVHRGAVCIWGCIHIVLQLVSKLTSASGRQVSVCSH